MFGLERFGTLPISNSIDILLTPQLKLLAGSFARKAAAKERAITDIDVFIGSRILEVEAAINTNIDPNQYLFDTKAYYFN